MPQPQAHLRKSRPSCGAARFGHPMSDRFCRRPSTRRATCLSFDAASPDRYPPSRGVDWTWKAATRAIPAARNQKAFQAEERVAMTRQAPVAALQIAYGWLAYPALVIGLVGLLWELIRPRRNGRRTLAVAMTAVLVALLARIAVIAVIDALSYSAARNSQYVIPGDRLVRAPRGRRMLAVRRPRLRPRSARRSDNVHIADAGAGAEDSGRSARVLPPCGPTGFS